MEAVDQIIQRQNGIYQSKKYSDIPKLTEEEIELQRIESFNTSPGNRNEQDGYNCSVCRNKAIIMKLAKENGRIYSVATDCKCAPVRNSILKMKRSGLKDVIQDCTFDKWIATEEWQKGVKKVAVEFAKNPEGWFFIGGQPGCGKSHLCTAISRELLLAGKGLRYMQWREDATQIKGLSKEPEKRQHIVDDFKQCEVLYIDDLFKTGRGQDGAKQRPTSADVNLAFEILNYRYNKPQSITIISSELTADEILYIDEAVGSRIYERAKVIKIENDTGRNYRMKNQLTF